MSNAADRLPPEWKNAILIAMTTLIKPHLEVPISSAADLIGYLARGARPREQWGIGAEMEKLVVEAENGEAASFSRIEEFLRALEKTGTWQPVYESGRLIALLGASSSITLEPGGQLELSGKLCPDLHCCAGDFTGHVAQIVGAGTPLGLAFLGLGVQPFSRLEQIDWVPKERYRVMGPYMERTGDMGVRMMKQTAGLQVNLDFGDEADAFDKLQTALLMAPLLYALFANSPLMDGEPSGYLSTRGEIWSRTDPDRTGLPESLLRPGAGFTDYVDYALDVPMYFIARQGQFVDLTAKPYPFRRYLAEGFAGHRPTLADWDLHLSTLFPEARLRPQLEIRCVDSLPPGLTLGMAALVKGILYDESARHGARQLFTAERGEREGLFRASWRLGLKAPMRGRTLREAALDVLELARDGLRRQQRSSEQEFDETIYLDGLQEIADSGITLAERLLARWQGNRAAKIAILREHCGYV